MGKHILVIDDEQSVRDAFELALDGAGYEVKTAGSGAEGLAQAQARRPDLVFLDLRMPGMDGVETLRRLQQVWPGLTVYIITAFHQIYLEALREIQNEGIHFQLAKKPLAANDIREITRSVLEGPEASRHE
jgi:DNA-binding NtrC family response regulator